MLHFSQDEFAQREENLRAEMARRNLDAMLLFAPESQFWLTGYDTFGFCFFQCLVVDASGMALLTRSADLRQAQITSTITDIRIWKDSADADPASDLRALLSDRNLLGKRLGIETDTHGLTARNYQRLTAALPDETLIDASDLVSALRLVKSPAEIVYVRQAAALADDALEAALPLISPDADEGALLAAMQGAIFAGGGDYPGNEMIIGSGENALLCRYRSGRRRLGTSDQLTLEWAGTYRHYHAAMMRTVVVGQPTDLHVRMHDATQSALTACEDALRPGASMGDIFDAHATTLDEMGFAAHRLNACGYALGARFSPSWMEKEMFFEGAETRLQPGQVFFLHMILMDSESGTAMSLGRTSLVTDTGSESLSRLGTDLIIR